MDWAFVSVSGAVFLTIVAPLVRDALRRRAGPSLAEPTSGSAGALPSLSVVVAARDEAKSIEQSLESLLDSDLDGLEVVAVDDRSKDDTGRLIDRIAASDPRLTGVHVHSLPSGWLGKNHALCVGADRAKGEFILFTDADVCFEPTALPRALRYAVAHDLDQLCLIPGLETKGFWEKLLISFFCFLFFRMLRLHKVASPRHRAYVGVGAFNLVRAEAYRRCGGHRSMPLEVVDDAKLGKRIKEDGREGGGRCALGYAGSLVTLRWLSGLSGIVRGLEKNAFANCSFRPERALAAAAALLFLALWPVVGLAIGPLASRLLCLATWLSLPATVWVYRCDDGLPAAFGFAFPLAAVVMAFILLRSMGVTYRRGGVVWRGTLYPLAELRRGVV